MTAAAINTTYALNAGLNPEKDPLIKETADSLYVNIVAVREDTLKDPRLKIFQEAYQSPENAQFIKEKFKGSAYVGWKENKGKSGGNHIHGYQSINRDDLVLFAFYSRTGFSRVQDLRLLAEVLRQAGYDVTEHVGSGTGLTGVLRSGKPGPVVALRSDMDSLVFRREDGTSVCAHACGHDAHMAMVLTAARVLAAEGLPCGNLKILSSRPRKSARGP